MSHWSPSDVLRLPVSHVLSWACAVSPFIVLSVVAVAALHQQPQWTAPLGSLADEYREVTRAVLHVAWSLSMMFTAYVAGPLWLILLCIPHCRSSWKVHSMQIVTFRVGWLLWWLLLVEYDLLNKIE